MQRRTTTKWMALMVAFWLVGISAADLIAGTAQQSAPQAPAAQAAGQEPQDQFVPVKSLPQQEQLPAAPLLLTAYGFVWAVLLVYLWTIWRRLMKIEGEMQSLSLRVTERAARR